METVGNGLESEEASRWFAQVFRKTDRRAASRRLEALREPDGLGRQWLEYKASPGGSEGHRYWPGPAMQKDTAWAANGRVLFGATGYLTEFIWRPAIKYSGLGVTRSAVLGYLCQHPAITMGDIHRDLRGLAGADTLSRAVVFLVGEDPSSSAPSSSDPLVVRTLDGTYRPVEDLDGALGRYEVSHRLLHFARKQELKYAGEQAQRHEMVRNAPSLHQIKAQVRDSPCIYCDDPPTPGSMTVEHFPPKHWGGSDRHSLLLPAHKRCNSRYGRRIRSSQPLPPPHGRVAFSVPTDELPGFLIQLVLDQHAYFVDALLDGDVMGARERIGRLFPLWVALQQEHVRQISPETGEVNLIEMPDIFRVLMSAYRSHRIVLRHMCAGRIAADHRR